MANGKGCECGARGECECGCGVDWTPQEVYDLRTENAVLRGCEEILKKRIALLEAKCEFLSKGDAEKYQKRMDELTKGGWHTGSTEHFLGLTEEEVDTIDGWMEERKSKPNDE
jgi:hypothetical protein